VILLTIFRIGGWLRFDGAIRAMEIVARLGRALQRSTDRFEERSYARSKA
jgi:hypothetical protein